MHEEQLEKIIKIDEEKKKMSVFKSFMLGFIAIIGVSIILSLLFLLTIYILSI